MRLLCVVALAGLILATFPDPARAGKPRWQTLPMPPALPRADVQDSVDVRGAKIVYTVYGKGDPVVLLHGGLGNSSHFGFQLPALIDRFQVIAIDSRGQGRSTRGSGAISYDQMAADVIAVLDKLAIKRASIVGWSDGGEIALKLAIGFSDRVDRLFVFAANYDFNGSKPRGVASPTFNAYSIRCRGDYARMSRTGLPYNALVETLLPLWRNPTGITREQLQAISAPVMMADGDHDEIIMMAQIEEMAALIPNAQLTVFEDTSHFALWQDPDAFNRAMVEFLAASTATPAPRADAAPGGAAHLP
ncbi:MAG TPA: alpha/beta hydrolase [Kofleriaceae bacterium]|nr:alpha/beta hydrolase [Kofleriaceae bacterium]